MAIDILHAQNQFDLFTNITDMLMSLYLLLIQGTFLFGSQRPMMTKSSFHVDNNIGLSFPVFEPATPQNI